MILTCDGQINLRPPVGLCPFAPAIRRRPGCASLTAMVRPQKQVNFWEFVHKLDCVVSPTVDTPCWIWTGCRFNRAYGRIMVQGKPIQTHRYSWQLEHGKIPQGLHILHKCDIGLCVNPEHLFVGNATDNMRDCLSKGRYVAHKLRNVCCPNGHPYNLQNTFIRRHPNGKTSRMCKECNRIRGRYNQKKIAAQNQSKPSCIKWHQEHPAQPRRQNGKYIKAT